MSGKSLMWPPKLRNIQSEATVNLQPKHVSQ